MHYDEIVKYSLIDSSNWNFYVYGIASRKTPFEKKIYSFSNFF